MALIVRKTSYDMARVVPLVALLLAGSVNASVDLNHLRELFESGDSRKAYDYAVAEVTRYEGEADFDYYYGVSAIDTGHASEGVFALERVLLSQPENNSARLELARGYFILEEYARSRKEFETVLKLKPPADVSQRINTYLDSIRLQEGRYTTTQTALVELGFGSDSNVNSGPGDPVYSSPIFGSLSIGDSSVEQDDNFSEATLKYGVNSPLTPGTSFFALVTANARSHDDQSEFDSEIYTGMAGFEFLHARDTYTLDLTAQQFDLDDNDYRRLIGVNTNWKRRLSQQSTVQGFLQFAQQEFDGQESRNADTATLGAGFSRRFNALLSPVLFTSAYLSHDTAEDENAKSLAERDYYGFRVGAIASTSARSSAQFTLFYQESEYGEIDSATGVVRKEDYFNTAFDFTWLIDRNWKLLLQVSRASNDANVSIYEYDRTQFKINLGYEFK